MFARMISMVNILAFVLEIFQLVIMSIDLFKACDQTKFALFMLLSSKKVNLWDSFCSSTAMSGGTT